MAVRRARLAITANTVKSRVHLDAKMVFVQSLMGAVIVRKNLLEIGVTNV